MNKAMLVVMDGLGDRPIKELGDLTPLEAAHTPNLDRLAARGITGLMNALGVGLRPGSDTSHLAILGYDIESYYTGRGPIEVAGLGMAWRRGTWPCGAIWARWTATSRSWTGGPGVLLTLARLSRT